jgi:collagen type III alpha
VPVPSAQGLHVLPGHLARVLERSTPVPAGRSFFSPERDPWLTRAAPLVPPQPGVSVVFAHGTTTDVVAAGAVLSPRELAAIIRADPLLAGRRVRLFACDTGRLDDGFAARLARELGVEVEAPTQLAWLGPGGEMSTSSGRLMSHSWVQTVPHDGRWRTFAPRDH